MKICITPFVRSFIDTFKEPVPHNPPECIGAAAAQLTKAVIYGASTFSAASFAYTASSTTAKILWLIPAVYTLIPTLRNVAKFVQNVGHFHKRVLGL